MLNVRRKVGQDRSCLGTNEISCFLIQEVWEEMWMAYETSSNRYSEEAVEFLSSSAVLNLRLLAKALSLV